MDFRALHFVFRVVMGRSMSPTYSSFVPFLLSYGTFGGVLGVVLVGMLPLCLSFGPAWVVLPARLLLSMLHGLLAHHLFFSIYG